MSGNKSSYFDFDAVAASYDTWYNHPVGRLYDAIEKRAIEAVLPSLNPGARLLEVGCGTGHWSEFFTQKGFEVTGVDVSAEMVKVASGKNIPRAKFNLADAVALPFDDDAFDVAAAITVLEFAKDPVGVVAEMVRCVHRGGNIIVGVLNKYSLLTIFRKLKRSPIYEAAHFYSHSELLKLLSYYGESRVHSVGYVLPWRWALWTNPIFEFIGKAARLGCGDFLVGEAEIRS